MPIQLDRNVQYTAHVGTWKLCRHAAGGEAAVKAAGETYLPKIGGQSDDQYQSYKERSRFYNSFLKTVRGHVGLALRKPTVVSSPESLKDIDENIDRKGSDIRNYVRNTLEEMLITGRCGTLIDYSKIDASATLADVIEDRPYWARYDAENILDWEFVDNNLAYCVLREYVNKRGLGVVTSENYRYRVLELLDGVYIQTVYIGDSTEGEVIKPMMGGKALNFIPFVFHQTEFSEEVVPPPLLDLVNLCMSHYRLKADHMHALHYVALPTPWVTGVTDTEAPKTIGPESIWAISNENASVGMLEFQGGGVGAIREELKSMEDHMAILGARILLPELAENTATASTLRSISETSDLASFVGTLMQQVNRMYDFTAQWAGVNEEVEIKQDTNFIPKQMDAGMLTALVGAWQSGAYDRETLTDNLQKAELIDGERDLDEMLSNIEAEEGERLEKAAQAIKEMSDETDDETDDEEDDEDG